MKKIKSSRSQSRATETKKAIPDPIYTELLDKAMQSSDDTIKKNVICQPETVDLNHRFGKTSGST